MNIFRMYLLNILLCSLMLLNSDAAKSQCWQSIECGRNHTMAIKTDGTLWGWGWRGIGQIGDGVTGGIVQSPIQIGSAKDWQVIAAGGIYNVAIKSDGTLWAWGANSSGQLGDGTFVNKSAPIQIGNSNNWQSISAGGEHTVAIKTDGTLWAWGANSSGQLGDGKYINRNTPIQIGSTKDWQSISAGSNHTLAIKTDGTLWSCGNNNKGQLGDGTNINKNTLIQIGSANNWQSIAAGELFSVATRTNGSLWSWGYNYKAQLGDGTTINKNSPVQIDTTNYWVKIASGDDHTLAIRIDSTLWAWGKNDHGSLGLGTFDFGRLTPTQVGLANNWQSISAGEYHTEAIKTDGTLWACGYNSYGEVGDGTHAAKAALINIIINSNCTGIVEQFIIENNMEEKISKTNADFCVATDGGSSIFKLKLNPANICQEYILQIKMSAGSDIEQFGKITKLSHEIGEIAYEYKHPTSPPINPDGSYVSSLNMELLDSCANLILVSYNINLVPTLPVYIHGFSSSGESMTPMKNKISSDLNNFKNINWVVDYFSTNSNSFEHNSNVVPYSISSLFYQAKNEGCAASKVDLIGHSMGGNLARQYIQGSSYRDDVRKLITINTPHYGSILANLLWNLPLLNSTFTALGIDRNGGAVYDLRLGSSAISNLNTNIPDRNISTHGIYSTFKPLLKGFDFLISLDKSKFFIILSSLFEADDINSDGVVSVTSQKGGLPLGSLTGYNDLFHTQVEGDLSVIENVKQLLLESPSSIVFSDYRFQPSALLSTDDKLSQRSNVIPSITVIASKYENIKIGDTITFNLVGQNITSNIIYSNFKGDSVFASYNNGLIGQYHFIVNKNIDCQQTFYIMGINADLLEVAVDSLILNMPCITSVNTKAILSGPYIPAVDTMSTTLRTMSLLSIKCPYDTTAMLTPLPSTMVDWVHLALVDTLTGDTTYASQCACLLKNGSIQNINGDTTLAFIGVSSPYVSLRIKHRNHLSARSRGLSNTPGVLISFDFRSGTNLYIDPTITGSTYHNVGQPEMLTASGRYALWPGDANGDGQIKYQGSGNDRGVILSAIGGTIITNTVNGYHNADLNLNGQVKYQGSGNDRGIVLSSIGGSVITKVSKAHD